MDIQSLSSLAVATIHIHRISKMFFAAIVTSSPTTSVTASSITTCCSSSIYYYHKISFKIPTAFHIFRCTKIAWCSSLKDKIWYRWHGFLDIVTTVVATTITNLVYLENVTVDFLCRYCDGITTRWDI